MTDCLFCHPDTPDNQITARTASAYARLDNYPAAAGHMEIVPLRHVESVHDLTGTEWADIHTLIRAATSIVAADGWTIGINEGTAAGRTIDHLHVHLIPRRWGDVPDPRGGVRAVLPGPGADAWQPAPAVSAVPGRSAATSTGEETARDALAAVLPAAATHTDRDAVLAEAERAMLNYALNQAQLRMWKTGGFTAEEQAAIVSLRRLAVEPAAVGAGAATTPGTETVAYRSNGGRLLRCLAHAPEWAAILTGDFHPVTSEDLPDGGICTYPGCGVDVLIPQKPPAAPPAVGAPQSICKCPAEICQCGHHQAPQPKEARP